MLAHAHICARKGVSVRQLFDRSSCTYTYIVMCVATKEAIIIDPVLELTDRDIEALTGLGASLKFILNTHVHADHITGSAALRAREGFQQAKTIISKASGAVADMTVSAGEKINFGEHYVEVRPTPGHTPGCVTYVLDDQSMLFCGDTLLIRGCGRTDFQGGSPETLYDSVHSVIFSLPDETVIFPGHDYTGRTSTTVGEEKQFNPRLTKNKAAFTALMNERFDGSKYPEKLDVALPANMVCGVFEGGGFGPTDVPVKHPSGWTWTPQKKD